jgi:ApaG protein
MLSQITKGVKISVLTYFDGTYFKNHQLHYAFAYQITIENHSKDIVQLVARHWEILDALKPLEIVDGEGVIGKKPIIKPGEHFIYESHCLLASPLGSMSGYFEMVNFTNSRTFTVDIPLFKLGATFILN